MGRSAALKMAEQGASVVVTDVCRKRRELEVEDLGLTIGDDFDMLQILVEEIEAFGGRALALVLDVTDAKQIADCVRKTCDTFGGVDILFNNAGVAVGVGPFLDIPEENWDLSWQVNVKGMVEMCRAVIPFMKERGGGAIINNSSVAGQVGMPGYAGYTTTKHAVVGLTKALAVDFGPDNIRCNAICPGAIMTDMGETEVRYIAREHGIGSEEAVKMMGANAALKRVGQPAEVGDVVAYLAGPAASFLTGVQVPVGGGWMYGLR
jgi:3-oxoacyl-[acyl-carrier protein] reductase